MKKISSLGRILSKNEQKKIIGGLGELVCPSGSHKACQISANSCGAAQVFDNCDCAGASWNCSGDHDHCTTICVGGS